MNQTFIKEEPRGELLRGLLEYTLEACDGLMLIEPDSGLSETGKALLERLKPHRVGRGRTSGWPGHTMSRGAATALYYDWVPEVCEAVLEAGTSLYDFKFPDMPEGLCIQKEQTPWLVAHPRAKTAYVNCDDDQARLLAEALPGLGMVVPDPPAEPDES